MIFAYQPDEAEQAFRQAARLDPTLAMAWWGIGLAIGPNINIEPEAKKTATAAEALARGRLLAGKRATESERAYIEALTARYTADPLPDFDGLATAYRDAMRALVQKFPDDPDASALFAEAIMDLRPWRLWSNTGVAEPGTQELVDVIERGLARYPDHLGLLHFYIHALEASDHPERALPMARRLAALPMEPAAAHLTHMPAHIYMRVGDWEAAAGANVHAVHQSLDYKLSADPKAQRACGHCADFLSYAYMMGGDFAGALKAAQDYQQITSDPTNTLAVLIRFGRWDPLLKFAQPGPELKPDSRDGHAIRGFWHFGRGLAFTATGQGQRAQHELDELVAETALAPATATFGDRPDVEHVLDKLWQTTSAVDLQIACAVLRSRIAESKQRLPESIALMRKAVQLQDEIPYSEPPAWFYPVRESLGALLLRAGMATEAEAVFREDLHRSPNNPRSLLGLSAALGAQGHAAEATSAHARFEAAWQHSDVKASVADL